jgi:hypothetical protein
MTNNLLVNNIVVLLSFVLMGFAAIVENPALGIFGLGSLLFELITDKKNDIEFKDIEDEKSTNC